jgi:hypothetical protein
MSVQIMGEVWNLALPHSELLVLLALSDHADHEGENVRPGIPLVAWKTGYSERQVQRVMTRLEGRGILQVMQVRDRDGKPRVYRIDLSSALRKEPLERGKPGRPPHADEPNGVRGNPVTSTTKPGDIHNKPGDIAMSPEPSLEPSIESTYFAREAGDGGGVEVRKAGRVVLTPDIEGAHEDWREMTGRRATLDERRAGKYRDRLKDGYTRNQLRLAVQGALANDYFSVQHPQFLLPETLFRDEGTVERHMAHARHNLTPEPWWPPCEDHPSPPQRIASDDMRIRAADIDRFFGGGVP